MSGGMSPEDMVGIEEMVSNIETVLNSFADASTRIKQRLVAEGWTQETAEAFAVATVGTMATGLMSQFTTPPAQVLEELEMPRAPLVAFVLCAISGALTVTFLIVLMKVVL